MIFASKTLIIENFRKILREIKYKNYNSKILSYFLIIFYFSSLASSLIYDRFAINGKNQIDELFLKIIYYSDLSHIFRDYIGNDHILMIIFIAIYAIHILFYVLFCGFYNATLRMDSRIIEIIYSMVCFYQKIYIWAIAYPSFTLTLYFFIHKSYSVLYTIEATSLAILICLWHFIFYYTTFETIFLPKNEFAIAYTNNFHILIFSALLMSIFRTALPITNYNQIMLCLGILISIINILVYWKDLPFINEDISKFYGCVIHLEIYLLVLIGEYQIDNPNYTITGIFILGTLFIIQIFFHIRDKISTQILYTRKIEELSNANFYFLTKKVMEWIKAPLKDRKFTTMYLVMFLRTHAYSCRDQSCLCKKLESSDIDDQNQNQYEKHYIVLQYKHLIYQVINNYFELKIASLNSKSYDIEFKVSQILFLMYHAKQHIKAYVMICTLINSKAKFGIKLDFKLKNIREEMEEFMFGEEKKSSHALFKDVLDFYDMLLNLRENIIKLMNFYCEFLYKIASPVIDLDGILKKGKEMMFQRKNIQSIIGALKKINKDHKELNEVINLYTSLNTVDDSNMKLLDEKKIAIGQKNNKNMIQKSDNFAGGDSTLLELFELRNCVIFIQLTAGKIGMIKKVTPNFLKMFGYPASQAELFNISHFMPLAVGLHHNNFVSSFVERNQSRKLDVLVPDGYGLHKNGYIFMMDVYIKMECFNGELCIAGCVHKKDVAKEVLLTTANGYILNFTPGFKKLLFLPVNTGKPVYDLPLPLIIPRLILTMGAKISKLSKLYQYFDVNGIPNFELMIDDIEVNNQNAQTGDIVDELVYAFLPKSKELIDEIMASFNQVANINHQDENIMFDEYIKGTKFIYEKYDHTTFSIYKLLICYKERTFRGGFLHIRILEVIYPSLVKNSKQVIEAVRHYLERLQEFYHNYDSKDAFTQFKIAFKQFSPLYHQEIDKKIEEKESTQEIIEVSNKQTDSMDDLEVSEKEAAKEIHNPKQPHSPKILFSPRRFSEVISPTDIGFGLLNELNSPNSSINNLLYSPQLMTGDAIMETKEPINSNTKNTHFLQSEPITITVNNGGLETVYDNPGTGRGLLLQSFDPIDSFSPRECNKTDISKILVGKNDGNLKLMKLAKQLKAFPKIKKTASKKPNQNSISNEDSQQNDINGIMLRSDVLRQKQSDEPVFKKLNRDQAKQTRELEERQSASSRASSTATTTRRFRNLLSDDVSVSILHKVNQFGSFAIMTLIVIILTTFVITQQTWQNSIKYIETANYANKLLSSIASYSKFIEMKSLYNNNLLNNLDFNTMEKRTINLLTIKKKEYKSTHESIISSDNILNDLFKLNYSDYNFNITLLNEDNTKSNYQYTFYYGIKAIFEKLDIISNTANDSNSLNNNSSDYIQNSSKYYLRTNYDEYFDTLMKISARIMNLYYYSTNLNIRSFCIIMLILFICIGFIVALAIYPIFYYIETRKIKGLSLISTFSLKDIEAIQTDAKFILLAIQNPNVNAIKGTQKNIYSKKKRKSLKSLSKIDKGKKKAIRDWKAQKTNPLKFIAIIVFIFGLLTTYFIVNSTRIINHNQNINQFYNEFGISNDLIPCIQTEYFIAYHALNLFSYDSEWQAYFNQNNLPIMSKCHQKIQEINYFWQMIDVYINDNSDITNDYKLFLLTLKSSDLCNIIDSIDMTSEMMLECQNALHNAAKSGFVQLINPVDETLQNLAQISTTNSTQAISQDLINGIDFEGLDILMYYSNFIFTRYIRGIKNNFEIVLSRLLLEGYAFLFIGIGVLLLVYLIFWMPLLKFSKVEFKTVKRIYCLFPLEMVISNQYIKKWLEDNAKKVE